MTTESKIAKRALRNIADSREHCGKVSKRAEEAHRFMSSAGDQWDREDRQRAQELLIPALNINDIETAIEATSGQEITGRFQPKLHGRDPADEVRANGFSDFFRVERDRCFLEIEESDAFRDLLTGGIAAVNLATELRDGMVPETVARNLAPWEIVWDHHARRKNLMDRRWHAVGRWVDLEEAKRKYDRKGKVLDGLESTPGIGSWGESGGDSVPQGSPWAYSGPGAPYDAKRGQVFLTEYEWRESDTSFVVEAEDERAAEAITVALGRPPRGREELDVDQFEDLERVYEEIAGAPFEAYLEIPRQKYHYAILAGERELQTAQRPENYWTTLFMTGFPYKQRSGTEWYGLVRKMMDRQKFANYYYSAYIQIIGTIAKNGYFVKSQTFEDMAEAEKKMARPGALIEVTDLEGMKPIISSTQGLSALQEAWSWCREEITAPAGVSRYELGRGGDLRRVSGSVLSQVRESSSTVLAIPFDSLKLFRVEEAQLLIRKLHAYWEPEDLARVIDPKHLQGADHGAWIEDKDSWLDALKWDIHIDEAPSSPTAKMELWNSLQATQSWQLLVEGPYAMPPDLFTSIFPYITGADRERWLLHIQQQAQQMAQQQMAGAAPPQP